MSDEKKLVDIKAANDIAAKILTAIGEGLLKHEEIQNMPTVITMALRRAVLETADTFQDPRLPLILAQLLLKAAKLQPRTAETTKVVSPTLQSMVWGDDMVTRCRPS